MNRKTAWTTLVDVNPVPDPASDVDPQARERIREAVLESPIEGAPPVRRPRAPARRLVATGTAVAAVLIAGLTLTRDGAGPRIPGVVTALADAVTASGALLHTVDDGPHVADASGGPAITRVESWAAVDGTARRVRTSYADGTFQDLLSERRAGRSRLTVYQSKTETLTVGAWREDTAPAEAHATEPLLRQVRDYAEAVRAGDARVEGEATIGGRPALRVVDTTQGPAAGTVWFLARHAATPALLAVEPPCPAPRDRCPPPTVYDTYEVTRGAVALPPYRGARAVHEG